MNNITMPFIIALSIFLNGCVSISDRKSDVVIEESVQSDAPSAKTNPNIVKINAEEKSATLTKCGMYALPDAAMGVGMFYLLPFPATAVVSAIYTGGHYLSCYYFRQHENVVEVDLTDAIEQSRQKSIQELREAIANVNNKFDEKALNVIHDVESIKNTIKDAADEERRLIEKTSNKAIRDLYNEIQLIKERKIHIIEE